MGWEEPDRTRQAGLCNQPDLKKKKTYMEVPTWQSRIGITCYWLYPF